MMHWTGQNSSHHKSLNSRYYSVDSVFCFNHQSLYDMIRFKLWYPILVMVTGFQTVRHDWETHMVCTDCFRSDCGHEMFEYCRLRHCTLQANLKSGWRTLQYGTPCIWNSIKQIIYISDNRFAQFFTGGYFNEVTADDVESIFKKETNYDMIMEEILGNSTVVFKR